MRPGIHLTRALVFADNRGVDGAVGGLAALVGGTSSRLRRRAERLRPVLCPDDARRRRRHPRCSVGDPVMSNFPWLTMLGLIPLIGAAVVAALPTGLADRAKHVALGASLVTLVLGIAAALQFETGSDAQFQLTEQHEWIPQFGVSYALGVDGIALVMILMALVLTPVCLLAAWNDVPEGGKREKNYFALILALETFMVGVFAATDVFLFYVFFEAMLIPVYFLIGSYGGPRAPVRRREVPALLARGRAGHARRRHRALPVRPRRRRRLPRLQAHRARPGRRARAADVPRLLLRLRGQGTDVAGAHLAARRRDRGPPGHRGPARRRPGQGRHLRHDPVLPPAVPRGEPVGHARRARARRRVRAVRRAAGHRPDRHHAADRLHLREPLRLHRPRHLRPDDHRWGRARRSTCSTTGSRPRRSSSSARCSWPVGGASGSRTSVAGSG